MVSISNRNTPSTSKLNKSAFTISPLEHIRRALNNPSVAKRLYFGPGIVVEEKQEFWHGELWQDSPLFGESKLQVNGCLYFFIML
jgi:hypothetical protein